jgi:hypothetical protein
MRMWLFLVVVALAACGSAERGAKPRKSLKERREAAEVVLSKPPVPRTFRFSDGELRVMEVPVPDSMGLADYQRCFIWRDDAYRTSSISCGQMPEVLLSNGVGQ